MLNIARSLIAVLFVTSVVTPFEAAAQPADKPALRSTMPAQVDPPRAPAPDGRPARVVQRTATADTKEKVNINSADVKELMSLTGVSRKVAERIVAYRDSHGPFKKPTELRKVDGVDDEMVKKNRARIVVR